MAEKLEIRALTGLRGLAALWVVIYHVHLRDVLPEPFSTFVRQGYLAVDLFFVLSGFVMALTYSHLFSAGFNLKQYKIFILRRIARTYPLYIATTIIIVLSIVIGISHALPKEGLAETFLWNVLLIQYWGLAESINLPAWSISTEFAAYLLFPFILWLVVRSNKINIFAEAIILLLVLLYISNLPTPVSDKIFREGPLDVYWPFSGWPLMRCLVEFTLGIITYKICTWNVVKDVVIKPWFTSVVTILFIVLLFIPKFDLIFVSLLPALILVLFYSTALIQKLFASTFVFFLGEISYSVYLLHSQFLRIRWLGTKFLTPYVGEFYAEAISLVLLYVSLIICSWVTFKYFEKPMRNWVRRCEKFI